MAEEKKIEEYSLEEAFQAVEALLSDMEGQGMSLEETFQRYEEGMKLIAVCNDKIDQVEKKLKLLQEDGSLKDAE